MLLRKGSPSAKKERKKEARVWENGGTGKEVAILDYSGGKSSEMNGMRKDESDEVENLVCTRFKYLFITKMFSVLLVKRRSS